MRGGGRGPLNRGTPAAATAHMHRLMVVDVLWLRLLMMMVVRSLAGRRRPVVLIVRLVGRVGGLNRSAAALRSTRSSAQVVLRAGIVGIAGAALGGGLLVFALVAAIGHVVRTAALFCDFDGGNG